MKTVTMKDLNALMAAVQAVSRETKRLSEVSKSAAAVTLGMANDNRAGEAIVFGSAGLLAITWEANRMYEDFERAAFNFTGEPRLPGEDAKGYFYRIASMTESEVLLSPIRNGLRLELWRSH